MTEPVNRAVLQEPAPDPQIVGRLAADVWNAVVNDEFMFIVIWSPPRLGKTTLAGWIMYSLYKDWDKVLQATVFDLPQLMHRLRHGLPERWPTKKSQHIRVPIVNWDDFGARSNKAETQYDQSFDLFKGGFDVIATKLGVLIVTMVDPNEPTFQLLCKYTHEVQIVYRGQYKYDQVAWQQNFHGFKTRVKKIPIEPGVFTEWPSEVYNEYDLSRMSLADEVFIRIDDATVEGNLQRTLKLIKSPDVQLLQLIDQLGPVSHDKAKEVLGVCKGKDVITRCKARNLVMPISRGSGHYSLEITELGMAILRALEKQEGELLQEVK